MNTILNIKNILKIALLLLVIYILIMVWGALFGKSGYIRLDHAAVVTEFQKLNRLESASYTIEKIIEAGTQENAFKNILYGDKILLIAHAEIIAGIDLTKISEENIDINGGEITVYMPDPEILVSRLDNDLTRVYDRQTGIFTKGDPELESSARQAAEKSIRQAACDQNILYLAAANAEKQLQTMFSVVGFENVEIVFSNKYYCK